MICGKVLSYQLSAIMYAIMFMQLHLQEVIDGFRTQ